MSLAVVLAYAALVLVAVLALLWSPWPAWMKGGLALGTTLLYFLGYGAVQALAGAPSHDALPERFVVVSSLVEEPSGQNKGALYLWVRAMRDGVAEPEPRAYRIAYSRELHEEINASMKKGRDGVNQMGIAVPRTARAGGLAGWLQPGSNEQEVRIRDLPLPQLPQK